jgi:hypothetical protein
MNNAYDLPFVYENETYNLATHTIKKMYNRGVIMNNDERMQLHDWAIGLMSKSLMSELSNKRLEYKIDANKNDPNVLPLVFEIRKRIECAEELSSFEKETYVNDFVTIVPTGGYIHRHRDPNFRELIHVRFNVFITLPKLGGTTYYDGHIIDSVECSYVLCRSGVDMHWSEPNEDVIPRISLSFGYLLTCEKVDELCKDTNIGIYTNYYPLTLNRFVPIIAKLIVEERGDPGSGTNICTIADVFTDAHCSEIINYITNNSALWNDLDVGIGNNVNCKFLSLNHLIKLGVHGSNKIDDIIFKGVNAALTAFRETRPDFTGSHDDGYTLRKIYGGTKRHIDAVHSRTTGLTKFIRALSLIAVLNDDYDGGIFNFPTQNLKIKVKKGEVIMFPPYWTHPHSVTSVGEGQARYTINTWIMEDFIG